MSRFSFLTPILFSLSCFIALSHALNDGFSVELIHRDSSKSPLYNPTETKFQRISNAVRRSINRANHFNKEFSLTINKPVSTITLDSADLQYFMSYSVGTPPFKVYGIIDTGSSLVWLQCKPCDICYNQTSPIFNPSKSSSYKKIRCSSRTCKAVLDVIYTSCSYDEDVCEYTATYGSGKSQGDLIVETLTFDSTSNSSVSFPKIVIGCGRTNNIFDSSDQGFSIVGLGSGHVSLTKQLGSSIGGKFSYCLIPFFGEFTDRPNSSGKLSFGDAAVLSGESVVSTPIAKLKGIGKDHYFLTLEAFSVGNKRIEFGGSKFEGTNISTQNILIDSGTPMNALPQHFYSSLESAVAEAVKLERVEDHKYNHSFSLCYNTTLKQFSNFPVITAHFSGADIKLDSNSTFVTIDKGIECFTFRPSQGLAIFGSFAQHNLLVGYDLERNIISFKPTDCTKH